MTTLHLVIFSVMSSASMSAHGSTDSACPSGLPVELMQDCMTAVHAASSDENGLNEFGSEPYNLVEKLQQWMDVQMRADAPRDDVTDDEGSDVAQQAD